MKNYKNDDESIPDFDFEEWNETSKAVDDRDHKYWKERQLLDVLNKASMPIAHVG